MQKLNLSDNRLHELGSALDCKPLLSRLDLSCNRLACLSSLPWMPHLVHLDVNDNPLRQVQPLLLQPSLESVDLAFCRLKLSQICNAVHALPQLRRLRVIDNAFPVAEAGADGAGHGGKNFVRDALVATVPWLEELDDEPLRSDNTHEHGKTLLAMCPRALRSLQAQSLGLCGAAALHSSHRMRARWQQGTLRPWHAGQGGIGAALSQQRSTEVQGYAALMLQLQKQAGQLATTDRALSHALWAADQPRQAGSSNIAIHRLDELTGAMRSAQIAALAAVRAQAEWAWPQGPQETAQLRVWRNPDSAARKAQRFHAAATDIQAAWRKRALKRQQAVQRRHHSAVRVQAAVRGWQTRKLGQLQRLRAAAHKRRAQAAIRIQAAARGWRVRSRLADMRAALQGNESDESLDGFDDNDLPVIEGLDEVQPSATPAATGSSPGHSLSVATGVADSMATGGWQSAPLPGQQSFPADAAAAAPGGAQVALAPPPRLLQRFRAHQAQQAARVQRAQLSVDSSVPSPEPHGVPAQHGAAASVACSACETESIQAPSELPSVSPRGQAAAARRAQRVGNIQEEWGFEDAGTAEAFLRRQRRGGRGRGRGRGGAIAAQRKAELNDPAARLQVHFSLPNDKQ